MRTWALQAMERELCTQLTTLAVLLLSEADGTADQAQPSQVTTKGKGKKRVAETGGQPLTSAIPCICLLPLDVNAGPDLLVPTCKLAIVEAPATFFFCVGLTSPA